ncbi:TPA: tail fiber assembly protein [Klebsiella aerogenes]|nr:tail fiber assembly protein [Klebsiella aerogenes]
MKTVEQQSAQQSITSEGGNPLLMDWVTYIKELQAIDTSIPENIKWPEPPTKKRLIMKNSSS